MIYDEKDLILQYVDKIDIVYKETKIDFERTSRVYYLLKNLIEQTNEIQS